MIVVNDCIFHNLKPEMPVNIKIYLDNAPVDSALSRKDYRAIIESSEFFWVTFCKVFCQIEKTGILATDSELFKACLKGNRTTIYGRKHIVTDIKNVVEQIRKLFLKAFLQRTNLVILTINQVASVIITEYADSIKIEDTTCQIPSHWHKSYVKPTLPVLCKLIGAAYTDVVVKTRLVCHWVEEVKEIPAFSVDWVDDDHFVFPIPPKNVSPREDLASSFHSMYKQQILCDISLVAQDGALNCHTIPLFINGGETIQKLLTCNMKESLERVIRFDEFSIKTLMAFVDYMYKGEKGLEPRDVREKNIDLGELLQMAHTYQVQPLIDCCTNLLSLFSSPSDLAQIKQMADFYENEHLKELHRYLLSKTQLFLKA